MPTVTDKDIITDINSLNDKYTQYENDYKFCKDYPSDTNCINHMTLTNDFRDISSALFNLDKHMISYKQSINFHSDVSFGQIKQEYEQIVNERQKLDEKLYELYTNDYESMYNTNSMVDTTFVTGIIWTILATSMIYYIVVKL